MLCKTYNNAPYPWHRAVWGGHSTIAHLGDAVATEGDASGVEIVSGTWFCYGLGCLGWVRGIRSSPSAKASGCRGGIAGPALTTSGAYRVGKTVAHLGVATAAGVIGYRRAVIFSQVLPCQCTGGWRPHFGLESMERPLNAHVLLDTIFHSMGRKT